MKQELKIFNDTIVQRELSVQLQQKCDIPEIWALNIVNGYHMQDYLAACAYGQKETDLKEEEFMEIQYKDVKLITSRKSKSYFTWDGLPSHFLFIIL